MTEDGVTEDQARARLHDRAPQTRDQPYKAVRYAEGYVFGWDPDAPREGFGGTKWIVLDDGRVQGFPHSMSTERAIARMNDDRG